MRIRNRALATVVAVAAVSALAACGPTGGSVVDDVAETDVTEEGLYLDGEFIVDQETYEAAQEQTLQLYTGYQDANQKAFNDAFMADTGVKVEYVRDVTNKLSERVLSEHGAGQLPADVIITSDYRIATGYSEAGIWEPYVPVTAEAFPDLSLDGGNFTKYANVVVSFGYNTQQVPAGEAPTSWMDLLDPKYAGKIGLTTGTAGGSSIALNHFLKTEVDPDYWTKMAAQNPTIFDSGGARQEALARGELMVATVGTAAINVAVTKDGAPIDYVVPDEGMVAFSFFIGKVADSANSEAAQVFINYALSKRGAAVLAQVGDFGARPDAEPPVAAGRALPALDSGKVWVMPAELEPEVGPALADEWKAAFGR